MLTSLLFLSLLSPSLSLSPIVEEASVGVPISGEIDAHVERIYEFPSAWKDLLGWD